MYTIILINRNTIQCLTCFCCVTIATIHIRIPLINNTSCRCNFVRIEFPMCNTVQLTLNVRSKCYDKWWYIACLTHEGRFELFGSANRIAITMRKLCVYVIAFSNFVCITIINNTVGIIFIDVVVVVVFTYIYFPLLLVTNSTRRRIMMRRCSIVSWENGWQRCKAVISACLTKR